MPIEEVTREGFIYQGPGCCIECGSPIMVVDSEITIMELNKEGIPMTEDTVMKVRGACSHCGKKYNMIRWKGGYLPCDKYSLIYRKFLLEQEIKDRLDKLNDSTKDKNPFL